MCIWVALKKNAKKKDIAYNYKSMVESTISASAMESDQKLMLQGNLTQTLFHDRMTCKIIRINFENILRTYE